MTVERPILFSAEMVRAILAGTKRQTRRVMNPQPVHVEIDKACWEMTADGSSSLGTPLESMPAGARPAHWFHFDAATNARISWTHARHGKRPTASQVKAEQRRLDCEYWNRNRGRWSWGEVAAALCPYGRVGDRLWVRETWGMTAAENRKPFEIYEVLQGQASLILRDIKVAFHYRADREYPGMLWRPSIFMPRDACRITLEIVGVRVERLQSISEEDALAEGVEALPVGGFDKKPRYPVYGTMYDKLGQVTSSPVWAFEKLWDQINGSTHPWESDCWVWVLDFKRLTP